MDPITAIASAVGGIFSSLPAIGIGSSARKSEIAAQAAAQSDLMKTQAELAAENSDNLTENWTKIIVVGGIILFVIIIVTLVIRKKWK